jgi:predicted DNA-binding transcriptional regulator YafY
VRADRLVSLVLLLQARGRTTARVLAAELEVSVRTIYRDLAALSAAGVPVLAGSGPGGGCQLLDDYRFPLRGLRPDEAEALLILGVPDALAEIGFGEALAAAQRGIQVTAGISGPLAVPLVHLDMPRWFRGQDDVPELRTLASATRQGRWLAFGHRRGDHTEPREAGPLGLVNKAGAWYLVAVTTAGRVVAYRAARIVAARQLARAVERPDGFDLAAFWADWSAEFAASRPRIEVSVRASPAALAAFPEVFGDGWENSASDPDESGWRGVVLSFEHEIAAAYRLAGFGGLVEVVSPVEVRDRVVATAHAIIDRYR